MIISQIEQKGYKFASKGQEGQVILNLDVEQDKDNHDKVVELLQQYRTWHSQHLLTTKNDQGTYASDAFKEQKALFCIGSSGGAGYSFPPVGSFDYKVCKVPYAGATERSAKYISQGPSIAFFTNKARTPEENKYDAIYSWKFYKYITNTVNNCVVCFNHSEGYVPVKKSCYKSSDWADYIADKDNMYGTCALVLKQDIGDNFISSLVFNGSATYRVEAGALVAGVLKTNNPIEDLIATAVNNTKVAMAA
jgi:ABC-type glycerol-3-phosphate transport system substrate-binding protein